MFFIVAYTSHKDTSRPVYICIYVHTYTCVHTFTHIHVYVFIHVCIYTFIHVQVYIHTCIYTCIQIYTCIRIYTGHAVCSSSWRHSSWCHNDILSSFSSVTTIDRNEVHCSLLVIIVSLVFLLGIVRKSFCSVSARYRSVTILSNRGASIGNLDTDT